MKPKINLPKIHLPKKPIAFLFSCFFVCYGMSNISDVQWIKWVMVAMGFYVEYESQYLLGLSNAYKRAKRKYEWLLGVYLGYIIVFGLFSGIGFFATEISVQETTAKKVETIEANNDARIKQLRELIDSKSKIQVREYEDNNGAGPVYKQMQREIDEYNLELKELLAGSKTVITIEKRAQVKDMFANLSKVTRIPKEILIIIMFGYALSIVYIALTIKPMEVDLESDSNATKSEPNTPKTQPITPVTGDVIGPEIADEKSDETANDSGLTEYQQQFITYVERLYKNINDSKVPVEINGLKATKDSLKGVVGPRICNRFCLKLIEWGAILVSNGKPTFGAWPKADIINKIREG